MEIVWDMYFTNILSHVVGRVDYTDSIEPPTIIS